MSRKRLFAALLLVMLLAGCGEDTPQSSVVLTPTQAAEAQTEVDIDITRMSGTMAYAEVTNMLTDPQRYDGKTVRVTGQFMAMEAPQEEGRDPMYYALFVTDETACCQQGLEFVLDGAQPADYPAENGTLATATGVMELYTAGGATYCRLRANTLAVV